MLALDAKRREALLHLEAKAFHRLGAAHLRAELNKEAGTPEVTHALAGRLYLSKSGWILLSVPNALVRGLYDALDEPGAVLPLKSDGRLEGHISVISKDELAKAGIDPESISERGHTFRFNLGPLKVVRPSSWKDVSKVWYVTVKSPELRELRTRYGLTPNPRDNKFDFHITIAIMKTLKRKEAAAEEDTRPWRERAEIYAKRRGSILTGLMSSGSLTTFGGGIDPGETPERAAARELLEETGWKVKNVRSAGIPPLDRVWWPETDLSRLSDEQRERRKKYRGDRTHFVVGDIDGKQEKAMDPSSAKNIAFRRPSTLLRELGLIKEPNVFDKVHLNWLSAQKKQADSDKYPRFLPGADPNIGLANEEGFYDYNEPPPRSYALPLGTGALIGGMAGAGGLVSNTPLSGAMTGLAGGAGYLTGSALGSHLAGEKVTDTGPGAVGGGLAGAGLAALLAHRVLHSNTEENTDVDSVTGKRKKKAQTEANPPEKSIGAKAIEDMTTRADKQPLLNQVYSQLPRIRPVDSLIGAGLGAGTGWLASQFDTRNPEEKKKNLWRNMLVGGLLGAGVSNVIGDRTRRYISNRIVPLGYAGASGIVPDSFRDVWRGAVLDRVAFPEKTLTKLLEDTGWDADLVHTRREMVRRGLGVHSDNSATDVWKRNADNSFSLNNQNPETEKRLRYLIGDKDFLPKDMPTLKSYINRINSEDDIGGHMFMRSIVGGQKVKLSPDYDPGYTAEMHPDNFTKTSPVNYVNIRDRWDYTLNPAENKLLSNALGHLATGNFKWFNQPLPAKIEIDYKEKEKTPRDVAPSLLSRLLIDKVLTHEHPWVKQHVRFDAVDHDEPNGALVPTPMTGDGVPYSFATKKQSSVVKKRRAFPWLRTLMGGSALGLGAASYYGSKHVDNFLNQPIGKITDKLDSTPDSKIMPDALKSFADSGATWRDLPTAIEAKDVGNYMTDSMQRTLMEDSVRSDVVKGVQSGSTIGWLTPRSTIESVYDASVKGVANKLNDNEKLKQTSERIANSLNLPGTTVKTIDRYLPWARYGGLLSAALGAGLLASGAKSWWDGD